MKLRPDWRRVLARAWSIRFIASAILVQAADYAFPWFREALPISDRAFGLLTIPLAVAAGFSRIVVQKGVTR